jgi:hypothetical protein
VFTKACHWSLYWARWIQSMPFHPIFSRSILILSSHLYLSLSCDHLPSGFPTKILFVFISLCILYTLFISSSLIWSF